MRTHGFFFLEDRFESGNGVVFAPSSGYIVDSTEPVCPSRESIQCWICVPCAKHDDLGELMSQSFRPGPPNPCKHGCTTRIIRFSPSRCSGHIRPTTCAPLMSCALPKNPKCRNRVSPRRHKCIVFQGYSAYFHKPDVFRWECRRP
jgi:hypothetical protein